MSKPALMAPWRPYSGQKEAIKQLADKLETTSSQVIRDAVADYIKKKARK